MKNRTALCSLFTVKKIVLVLLCLILFYPQTAAAAENRNLTEISLSKNNVYENIPFEISNLFPGDYKSKTYCINVVYESEATIFFRATVDSKNAELDELLIVEIALLDFDECLYKGSIADMPVLEKRLADNGNKAEELLYQISVSLDTRTGNEYQNKSITVDFVWWIDDNSVSNDDGSITTPNESVTTSPTEETRFPSHGGNINGDQTGGSNRPSSGDFPGAVDQPTTSDFRGMVAEFLSLLCIVTGLGSAILLILIYRGDANNRKGRTEGDGSFWKKSKNVLRRLVVMLLLIFLFSISTLALSFKSVTIENNLFKTGSVSVKLAEDMPLFDGVIFEPGMNIQREMVVSNEGSCGVYYRLYFTGFDEEISKALIVTLSDGTNTTYQGSLLTEANISSEKAMGYLDAGEEIMLQLTLSLPHTAGNVLQGDLQEFQININAVQAVNNPDQLFE